LYFISVNVHHHHHHHHLSVTELGHFLTRSGLTYPEISSKVYQDSFCPLGSSVALPWVIYFEAFYLHVVSSFYCIPVICPKLVLFLLLCNLRICFVICSSVSCCSSHVFHHRPTYLTEFAVFVCLRMYLSDDNLLKVETSRLNLKDK